MAQPLHSLLEAHWDYGRDALMCCLVKLACIHASTRVLTQLIPQSAGTQGELHGCYPTVTLRGQSRWTRRAFTPSQMSERALPEWPRPWSTPTVRAQACAVNRVASSELGVRRSHDGL
eukprot:CAMPEP_0183358442 /NCGR_PEP_ID=MMETSP0164_2-20130417/49223_1 /TAXON_ID=221442 /ORGANISM="Coccolithus pelagicus ssp braarudi, Strain PLY182g" /LENGTH=117 /DNA_ID=CAMNT_0025532341 /DNA_START=232 /DNA_END=582 /DNA_ORIENTATION=+